MVAADPGWEGIDVAVAALDSPAPDTALMAANGFTQLFLDRFPEINGHRY